MAYANGFNGDVKSLQYILQTLAAKEILIPGVTSNAGLQVSAMGEVAYFYRRGASTVETDANLGAQITYASRGVERVDVPLTNRIAIGAVIPHVNFATVEGVQVVADRVVQESLSAANEWNTEAVGFLEANADRFFDTSNKTVQTTKVFDNAALTKTNIYQEIVEMRKGFNLLNKVRGLKPTAIIVSEAVYALLLQSDEFIRKEQAQDLTVVSEGLVGRVVGLDVVVSPDMLADIIMLHAEAIAAPVNIRTLLTTDATAAGYPGGTIVAGEIGYGFEIGDLDLVLIREVATAPNNG